MNSTTQLLFVLLLASYSSLLFSQSAFLTFDHTSLDEVIKAIEEKSGYIFNYEPDILEEYYYSGKVNTSDFKSALTEILYDSPYTFDVEDNTVLVYRLQPITYRICGTVKGFAKEPLIAANITVPQKNIGHLSDESGAFDFQVSADKNQRINISYLGYQPISFTVQDTKDNCPTYNLIIDENLWAGEILVKDYLLDGILQSNDFGGIELSFDQLSKNHSNVEHDILKTIQLLPGINSIDDSATNLQIRGSSAGQHLIMWEGAPVYNAGHIFGMISAINPFSISDVNIYKGAYNPKYDNRVGAIIDMSLTDSINNVFNGSIGTTLTEVHANLEIPITDDRLSLVVSGRQSIKEIYDSPPLKSYTEKVFQLSIIDDFARDVESETINTEQKLNYNDWNTKLLYKASEHLKINIGAYNNQQNFKYAYSFDGDPFRSVDDIAVKTNIITAEADMKLTNQWSTSLSLYNSYYKNEYNTRESENTLLLRAYNQFNDITDRSFTVSNTFNLSEKWNISTGYEYNTKKVTLDLDIDIDPESVPNEDEQAKLHNLFLSLEYSDKNFKIDGGTRASYHQEQGTWVNSPRLNIQYFINKKSKVKFDAGVYHQFISQLGNFGSQQITVDNPLWILNTTNEQLSQKATKLALGYVFQDRGWLVDLDAYYNNTTGLSTLMPLFGLVQGERGFAKGSATATGIDFLLKKRWSKFNTWINYSFGINENSFPEAVENNFPAFNDIRHNVSIVSSYKLKNVQFSLNANYHSGLPYSIPNVILNDEEEEPPFRYFLEYDKINDNRLAPYVRLDLNINYRFNPKKSQKLNTEISLSLVNLFNTNNISDRGYYIDYNEENSTYRLAYAERSLLSRTPLLLLRFYW